MASQKKTETIATTSEEEQRQRFANKWDECAEKLTDEYEIITDLIDVVFDVNNETQMLSCVNEHEEDRLTINEKAFKINNINDEQISLCMEQMKKCLKDKDFGVAKIKQAQGFWLCDIGNKIAAMGNNLNGDENYELYLERKEKVNESAQELMELVQEITDKAGEKLKVDDDDGRWVWGQGAYQTIVKNIMEITEFYSNVFDAYEEWEQGKDKYVAFTDDKDATLVKLVNVSLKYTTNNNKVGVMVRLVGSVLFEREDFFCPMIVYDGLKDYVEQRGEKHIIKDSDTRIIKTRYLDKDGQITSHDPRAAAEEEEQPKKKPRRRGGKKHKKKKK